MSFALRKAHACALKMEGICKMNFALKIIKNGGHLQNEFCTQNLV